MQSVILLQNNLMKVKHCPLLAVSDWLLCDGVSPSFICVILSGATVGRLLFRRPFGPVI